MKVSFLFLTQMLFDKATSKTKSLDFYESEAEHCQLEVWQLEKTSSQCKSSIVRMYHWSYSKQSSMPASLSNQWYR